MPSTRDMELEAELEPDRAKHVELEPDGIKDMTLEVEEKHDVMDKLVANQELATEKKLVSKDTVAAPMEMVTHSGVNIEPRWRRHDPKPPWFFIQAQEISKWHVIALFFPYLWFCPNGFLMRLMFHIQITHFADQDPSPSSGKIENVAMKLKGLF
ncbi:unnamed protein product [Microthlaspi erraticum]|uniref:Uncharacterized protein n=1 Tax=Microthlaspi erraticum TaxID=1685480 RepID=A0A6D2I5L5_9BRAS|nr:unnamed protein product [Microthlaspi erraticum]